MESEILELCQADFGSMSNHRIMKWAYGIDTCLYLCRSRDVFNHATIVTYPQTNPRIDIFFAKTDFADPHFLKALDPVITYNLREIFRVACIRDMGTAVKQILGSHGRDVAKAGLAAYFSDAGDITPDQDKVLEKVRHGLPYRMSEATDERRRGAEDGHVIFPAAFARQGLGTVAP